jgi:exosome complex component MTR3
MSRPYPSLSNCYVPLTISALGLPNRHDSENENKLLSVDSSANAVTKTDDETVQVQKKVRTRRDILLHKVRNGQRDSGDNTDTTTIREIHSLRHVHIESGILNSTNDNNSGGSSLVEIGRTKVICQVIGPITQSSCGELIPSSISQQYYNVDEGFLYVDVSIPNGIGIPYDRTMEHITSNITSSSIDITTNNNSSTTTANQSNTSNISTGRLNSIIKSREKEIATNVLTTIQSSIPLSNQYAKNAIVIKITILQDDGSIIPACTVASIIALCNASIELYDIPTSCTVAIVCDDKKDDEKEQGIQSKQYYYLADPTSDEILYVADAIVTVGYMCNWKEITYWDVTGKLHPTIANTATNLCYDGCRTFHRFIREHLLSQNINKK